MNHNETPPTALLTGQPGEESGGRSPRASAGPVLTRPSVDLRSVRTIRRRNAELRATLAFSVDAGWADGLVLALADIARGHRDPAARAHQALDHAGVHEPERVQQTRLPLPVGAS